MLSRLKNSVMELLTSISITFTTNYTKNTSLYINEQLLNFNKLKQYMFVMLNKEYDV